MSDYTPTTDDVRFNYAMHSALAPVRMGVSDLGEKLGSHLDAFDRWLAAHDAEVRAGVVAEEPGWEYGHDCDESRATHGLNSSPQNEWPAMGTCTNATSYRRRKAGPWEPVEN